MAKQIRSLPLYLQAWLIWLTVTTLIIPLVYIESPFFQSMMICQIGNILFGGWLMLRYGLVKLLSLAHIVFWTPILAKFLYHFEGLQPGPIFLAATVTSASVLVSLILDARDYRAWLHGDRRSVGQ
ncbi:hypothetical protein [Salinarimonas sp.]|uniref:hypothetical protein n=1 Tax=Salinarimonas sp. TaxID=2766526 RepID=UPI0032D96871